MRLRMKKLSSIMAAALVSGTLLFSSAMSVPAEEKTQNAGLEDLEPIDESELPEEIMMQEAKEALAEDDGFDEEAPDAAASEGIPEDEQRVSIEVPAEPSEEEKISLAVDQITKQNINGYDARKDELREQWKEVSAQIGKIGEIGTPEVKKLEDRYEISQIVTGENGNAEFLYTVPFLQEGQELDESLVTYSVSAVSAEEEKESFGSAMTKAALNTLMGLGIVFIVLIFLSFVISLFKRIPQGGKKKEEEIPVRTAPVQTAPVAPEAEEDDEEEIAAVIAAAIAAMEGTTPDGFVVRSIRKVNRSRR